jgi:hypothetical protein
MRNPERLDTFYDEFKKIHKEYFPDWRFGQFIENIRRMTRANDLFYYEEDSFLELVKSFIMEVKE